MIICIFGDSITWGAWDLEKGGWVNRLWLYFGAGESEVDVYNLGISGDATSDLLKRFDCEAQARKPDVIIFDIGSNDSSGENSEENHRLPPEQFKKNLDELINLAKKFTDKIIFLGSTMADESKTLPVSWNNAVFYSNKNLKIYGEMIKEVAGKNSCHFLDLFDLLGIEDLDDGLHPNAQGHEKIFIAVKNFLLDNKLL